MFVLDLVGRCKDQSLHMKSLSNWIWRQLQTCIICNGATQDLKIKNFYAFKLYSDVFIEMYTYDFHYS